MSLKPPPPQTIYNCPHCDAELMHEEQLANQCWTCAETINPDAEPYRPELINEYLQKLMMKQWINDPNEPEDWPENPPEIACF